jgi:hypothetical protein
MKAITAVGFRDGRWLQKNRMVMGGAYRVHAGGIQVDGVRFVFEDDTDAYSDGTIVAVRIYGKRRRNYCQTQSEYEEEQRKRRERIEKDRHLRRTDFDRWLRSIREEE